MASFTAQPPTKSEDWESNLKRLRKLLKLTENRFCADCGVKGPRWTPAQGAKTLPQTALRPEEKTR